MRDGLQGGRFNISVPEFSGWRSMIGTVWGMVGWLVVLGLTALRDNFSVYIGPSPREREKEVRKDR